MTMKLNFRKRERKKNFYSVSSEMTRELTIFRQKTFFFFPFLFRQIRNERNFFLKNVYSIFRNNIRLNIDTVTFVMTSSFECFFGKRVPGQGLEQRESGKTVLYPLIIILLISDIIIKLLIKMRTISAETRKGTPM